MSRCLGVNQSPPRLVDNWTSEQQSRAEQQGPAPCPGLIEEGEEEERKLATPAPRSEVELCTAVQFARGRDFGGGRRRVFQLPRAEFRVGLEDELAAESSFVLRLLLLQLAFSVRESCSL